MIIYTIGHTIDIIIRYRMYDRFLLPTATNLLSAKMQKQSSPKKRKN